MPTEPSVLTVFQAVSRACEICAVDGDTAGLDQLQSHFEDDDRPISAVEDIEDTLDRAIGEVDVEIEPEVAVARAIVVYLAHRRDEGGAEATELMTLAARAEFGGHPPQAVIDWLEAQGAAI